MERPDGQTVEVEMHDLTAIETPPYRRMSYRAGKTDAAYPTRANFIQDVIRIMRAEMEALVRDRVSYIQLDERFVYYVSEWLRAKEGNEADPEAALAADTKTENTCYDAVRDDITVAMHLCGGSRLSYMHGMEGYDWLAEGLFNALGVDRYLLEYDLDYGGFEALRFIPKGKVAVLGLISSKKPQLETQDSLLRRSTRPPSTARSSGSP